MATDTYCSGTTTVTRARRSANCKTTDSGSSRSRRAIWRDGRNNRRRCAGSPVITKRQLQSMPRLRASRRQNGAIVSCHRALDGRGDGAAMAEQLERAQALRDALGTLGPGPGTTARDLRKALGAVEDALAGGQALGSTLALLHRVALSAAAVPRADLVATAAVAGRLPLEPVARDIVAPRERPDTKTLVALRTVPLASEFSPLTVEWARGIAPGATHGPFLTDLGE